MQQLECELRLSAQFGQEILARHDASLASMEVERAQMALELEKQALLSYKLDLMTHDQQALEERNAQTMAENLALLRRLNDLDTSLYETASHNLELRSSLEHAEVGLSSLRRRAAQTDTLESQILELEQYKQNLELELELSTRHGEQHSRQSSIARKHILSLQKQLDNAHAELDTFRIAHFEVGPVMTRADRDAHQASIQKTDFKLDRDHPHADQLQALYLQIHTQQEEIAHLRSQIDTEDTTVTSEMARRTPLKQLSQEFHKHSHFHYHGSTRPTSRKSRRLYHRPNDAGLNMLNLDGDYPSTPRNHKAGSNNDLEQPSSSAPSSPLTRDSGYHSGISDVSYLYQATEDDEYLDSDAATPTHQRGARSILHSDISPSSNYNTNTSLYAEFGETHQSEFQLSKEQSSTVRELVMQPADSLVPETESRPARRLQLRPLPRPLQGGTASAIVSVNSDVFKCPQRAMEIEKSNSETMTSTLLRKAAAAQKSKSTNTVPTKTSALSLLWRKDIKLEKHPSETHMPSQWSSDHLSAASARLSANSEISVSMSSTTDTGNSDVRQDLLNEALQDNVNEWSVS